MMWRFIRRRNQCGLAAVATTAAAMLVAAPAQACQYDFAPEPIGGPSARFIMPRMFAAASFVDLAMAEGSQAIEPPPGSPNPPGLVAQGWSFRVVQRWKGNSTDRFILFGDKGDGKRQWDMTHWLDEQGRVYPYMSVREALVADPGQLNSCSPPAVSARPGSMHVVFREADGRLLGAVPFYPGMREVAGTSIAEINPLETTDWEREAQAAGAYAELWKLPAPAVAPDAGRATLRFAKPLAPSVVKALLARTGAVPFGVTLVRGSRTMDYRLGSELAMQRLIDDAIAWAQRTGTPTQPLTVLAGALADHYPLSSLAPDGATHRFMADILRLAREPEEQGPVLISAVQVVAGPALQQALRGRAEVSEVIAGRRVRNRVAIDNPPLPLAAALPSPVDVHRGLARVAGRNLSPPDLQGKWRLVASFTPLEEEVLTLEFAGNQVRATMPCAEPSVANYRIEGRILELKLPKPDLKACPQRRAFWTAVEIFDRNLFTARLNGDQMRLLTENAGDLEFAR